MKRLNELFDIDNDMKIYSIHSDSRYVKPYSIFFCIEGLSVDGHRYVKDAIFQGAKVIVHSKEVEHRDGIIYIEVADPLDELNRVSNIFYDYPSKKMHTVAVTGTSGKTVVASMVKQIMDHYCKAAYMGTISLEYDTVKEQCPYTTPETIYVQSKMADMVKRGVKVMAMEASSHGLALKRIDGVDFNTAVLTNVGEEHLDFHGTRERYIESKKKLFAMLSANSLAVLNKDEEVYEDFKKATKARTISYGIDHESEIMAKNIQLYIDHSEFDLQLKGNVYHISCAVIAKFNIYNILATVGVLIGLGLDDRMIVDAIRNLHPVPGRMELIENRHKITIIVDYCQHTRDHKKVFEFVSDVAQGKIIAVLGAPCKRHIKRRKALGKLANQYLDHVILTEVDNRGGNVEEICEEIQEEIKDVPSIIITKREIAVEQAIEQACPHDIVLLLGKGQEKFISLEVGQEYYPGDKEIAIQAMNRIYEGEDDDANQ